MGSLGIEKAFTATVAEHGAHQREIFPFDILRVMFQ